MQKSKRDDQKKRDDKKLQTGIARIWKIFSRGQGDPEMVGNGVLVHNPSFIQSELGVNAKYAILTLRKTLGEDDLLSNKTCDYKVEFLNSKNRLMIKDMMYSPIPKGSLLFVVLNTTEVERFLKNCGDRAFNTIDQTCIWKNGDDMWCHYVQGISPFRVLSCQLKCCKSECGDIVMDVAQTSLPHLSLPLGSLILNDEKEVLGLLGNSNGKYVVNTVVAALNTQGISCINKLLR